MSRVLKALPTLDPKAAVLFAACLLAVAVAAGFATGGHLNLDEGIYQLMVRDFIATGGPGLWNGYEEFPTRELTFPATRIHDGRLVSQYPQLYAMLAAPVYWLFGYDGLFLMNALAFGGVVWLTFWLGRRLFGEAGLGLNACLILVLATYAWEYTQAALPHVVSMLWILACACLSLSAVLADDRRRALGLALAAGLLAGFGIGVRLDTIFVLPALVVPFFFVTPWKPWQGLAVLLATAPGLAVMTALNHDKFGIASPFTYGAMAGGNGSSIAPYVTLAAAGALVLFALWLASRPRVQPYLAARRLQVCLGGALLLGLVLLTPQGWALAIRLADGVYQLVVDFRIRDLAKGQGGLVRGDSGSMIYMGGLKKSLLQSCPYLAALAVAFWAVFRNPKDRPALCWLLMIPATFVAAYGYFAWHGGLALNLRYFLPILPFTSILAAYAWADLTKDLPPWVRRALPIVGAATAALFALLVPGRAHDPQALEPALLTFPLVLAALVLLSALAALTMKPEGARAGRSVFALAMVAAFVWSGTVAYAYDLPKSFQRRYFRAQFTQEITPHIAADSIVFAAPNGLLYGLFERRGVRLAIPVYDNYRDLEALIRFHLEAGRPAYLWLEPREGPWLQRALESRGIWPRLTVRPVFDHTWGRLVRVEAVGPEAG